MLELHSNIYEHTGVNGDASCRYVQLITCVLSCVTGQLSENWYICIKSHEKSVSIGPKNVE